ncbi:alpha/beta hydrolase [Roseiflexus sp. RS-1]|jgi:pimeloyl-ACP methyl ester carboxylesterase|uniref:alpha/beta hydrolase n=1 Tax=Roseiflexus sp. (strain RS-1) TaxID=357808 RepID=UPI0000D81F61|nr:alpha/beta hydrolase [Roseiflexus sp. RS-1]ABQ90714.1 alpha/beta hydrolase fold [Roseiflexus sp. RS-1]
MNPLPAFTAFGMAALLAPVALTPLRERLAPADLPGVQHFVRVGEYDLHYTDEGPRDAPVVLLIHGFAAWAFAWRAQRSALIAAGRRVVTIDMIGYGASSRPAAPVYSTHDQALLILQALDILGITTFDVVGHSFGGRVAFQVALLAPERVRTIVAICPEAFTVGRPPIATFAQLPLIGLALSYYILAPSLVGVGLRSLSKRDDWLTDEVIAGYAAPLYVRGTAAAQVWQARSPKDGSLPVPANLSSIRPPTLLLWGDGDTVFPVDEGQRLERILPDARLIVYERTGHLPYEERPADVNEAIVRFLTGENREPGKK